MKLRLALPVVLALMGASVAGAVSADLPPIKITAVSTDPTYGSESNPIKTGGALDGVPREDAYLALLRGPNGESVSAVREGSCCSFPTPNGIIGGMGLLDVYRVTIGSGPPRKLYIDMYDYQAPIMAPVGFTFAEPSP